MCLHSETPPAVPEQTARVALAAFPKGNLYVRLREELGTLFTDGDFADLYPRRGQPAFAPWRLALVTVMQFLEDLSDRQAADAVRARIDWKYALGLELTDPGFHFSVLCEFRAPPRRQRRGAAAAGQDALAPAASGEAAQGRAAASAPTARTSWPPSAS